MSSTGNNTQWTLNIAFGANVSQMILVGADGITDDLVLQLGEAVKALAWPTGTTITLQKDFVTDESYQADFTQSPAVFT